MADDSGWKVLDHVCRLCYGRLLERDGVIRCAECDFEVTGPVQALCTCGAKLKNGRNAGLRCQVNPTPTLEQPARVVVVFVGEVAV
jgi:hypothetical protein